MYAIKLLYRLCVVFTVVMVFMWAFALKSAFAESSETVVIQTIIGEAASEKGIGMQAVAEVIRNRSRERNLSPDAVCLQKKQFSFWNDKQKARKWLKDNTTAELWHTATKAWYEAEDSNIVKGATMYDNFKLVKNPRWDFRKLVMVKKIGNHTFFREIK